MTTANTAHPMAPFSPLASHAPTPANLNTAVMQQHVHAASGINAGVNAGVFNPGALNSGDAANQTTLTAALAAPSRPTSSNSTSSKDKKSSRKASTSSSRKMSDRHQTESASAANSATANKTISKKPSSKSSKSKAAKKSLPPCSINTSAHSAAVVPILTNLPMPSPGSLATSVTAGINSMSSGLAVGSSMAGLGSSFGSGLSAKLGNVGGIGGMGGVIHHHSGHRNRATVNRAAAVDAGGPNPNSNVTDGIAPPKHVSMSSMQKWGLERLGK